MPNYLVMSDVPDTLHEDDNSPPPQGAFNPAAAEILSIKVAKPSRALVPVA